MEWKESVKWGIIIGRKIHVQCITPISNLWRIPKWVQVTLIRNRCPQFYVAQGYLYQLIDQYDFYDIVKKDVFQQLDKQYAIKTTFRKQMRVKDQNSEVILQSEKSHSLCFIHLQSIPLMKHLLLTICKSVFAKIRSWSRYQVRNSGEGKEPDTKKVKRDKNKKMKYTIRLNGRPILEYMLRARGIKLVNTC